MKIKILNWSNVILIIISLTTVLISLNCNYKNWQFWALWYCILSFRKITEHKDHEVGKIIAYNIKSLTALLVILKLLNVVNYSWTLVFFPLWGGIATAFVLYMMTK